MQIRSCLPVLEPWQPSSLHGTELLQMSWSPKQDMRFKLFRWLLEPNMFSWRQNNSNSYFASWGKIDTAQNVCCASQYTFGYFSDTDSMVSTKQDSDRIRLSFFQKRIGSDSKNPLSDHHCFAPRKSEQSCHSFLTSFPYNQNEESLHFPTQSETRTPSLTDTDLVVFIRLMAWYGVEQIGDFWQSYSSPKFSLRNPVRSYFGVKRNFWLAKFLTSHNVNLHRVIFYVSIRPKKSDDLCLGFGVQVSVSG